MATVYKQFGSNDKTTTRTLLHENIPVTGTIVSGTYGTFGSETNIKNFSHGMFQSVYDYPYLSSSSNHIFDITCGYSNSSALSASSNSQNSKKVGSLSNNHSTSRTIKNGRSRLSNNLHEVAPE